MLFFIKSIFDKIFYVSPKLLSRSNEWPITYNIPDKTMNFKTNWQDNNRNKKQHVLAWSCPSTVSWPDFDWTFSANKEFFMICCDNFNNFYRILIYLKSVTYLIQKYIIIIRNIKRLIIFLKLNITLLFLSRNRRNRVSIGIVPLKFIRSLSAPSLFIPQLSIVRSRGG